MEDEHCITNSMSLSTYMETLISPAHKLNWSRREAAKPSKYLLLSILAQQLKEQEAPHATADMLTLAANKGITYKSD